ncbi:MAG TPA: hypothetical protein VFI91_02760, partial [Longimicrobiaceae bacterium]|nr:hypothetical protein [Longimicrobiaceae bacterium]
MTDERRYHEEEIAEIFEAAATPPTTRAPARSPAQGLTLEELQAIGREVGVAPERIAAAASALDLRRTARPRKSDLGMPISVGRTFDLPRAPTDHEWGMLIAEIRETFGARGKTSSEGSLREWRNGNLRVEIEPTESGHRIRMSTRKNDAVTTNQMAIAALIGALILFAINFF